MIDKKEKNKEAFVLRPEDVLENMSEGLIVADLEGKIIQVNKALEKLWEGAGR